MDRKFVKVESLEDAQRVWAIARALGAGGNTRPTDCPTNYVEVGHFFFLHFHFAPPGILKADEFIDWAIEKLQSEINCAINDVGRKFGNDEEWRSLLRSATRAGIVDKTTRECDGKFYVWHGTDLFWTDDYFGQVVSIQEMKRRLNALDEFWSLEGKVCSRGLVEFARDALQTTKTTWSGAIWTGGKCVAVDNLDRDAALRKCPAVLHGGGHFVHAWAMHCNVESVEAANALRAAAEDAGFHLDNDHGPIAVVNFFDRTLHFTKWRGKELERGVDGFRVVSTTSSFMRNVLAAYAPPGPSGVQLDDGNLEKAWTKLDGLTYMSISPGEQLWVRESTPTDDNWVADKFAASQRVEPPELFDPHCFDAAAYSYSSIRLIGKSLDIPASMLADDKLDKLETTTSDDEGRPFVDLNEMCPSIPTMEIQMQAKKPNLLLRLVGSCLKLGDLTIRAVGLVAAVAIVSPFIGELHTSLNPPEQPSAYHAADFNTKGEVTSVAFSWGGDDFVIHRLINTSTNGKNEAVWVDRDGNEFADTERKKTVLQRMINVAKLKAQKRSDS